MSSLKVCTVLCGHVPEPAQAVIPDYAACFEDLLRPSLPEAEFGKVAVVDGIERVEDVHAHDVYVFSGSPKGVYEDHDWIADTEQLVRDAHDAGKTLVGICFGHQLISQALGGRVEKSDKGWGVGAHTVDVVAPEPWMLPALPEGRSRLNVLVSHQDQVIEPPAGAKTLISTDFCPHGMLRIGDRVLTMQGHPEMVREIVEVILEMRKDVFEPHVYEGGWKSLEKDLDHDVLGQWIGAFIREATAKKEAA
ncbi:MAG: GMP synthase [Alphaproteobacteria bacterium]|nr:GMP synthase [Alphaproteobacteria bacterium]